MANQNNPHGLRPLGISLSGGPSFIQTLIKAAANATAIFRQDVVARQSGGFIGADSITPGTTLLTGVTLDAGAALTQTSHLVVTSPDALYEAQSDGAGIVAANLGLNANLTYAAGATIGPKISGTVISTASAAVTSTLDVHLIQLYNDAVNNAFGLYSRIEVVINKQRYNGGTAGV